MANLGLGTVQWGMRYGIANTQGIPSEADVGMILKQATAKGISMLDTAPAYGSAENVLGQCGVDRFNVVTKTPVFKTTVITAEQAALLDKTFKQSLARLECEHLYGLLIHHVDDLFIPGGERLIEVMLRLKADRLVEKIGASIYDSTQIDMLLNRYTIDLVQLPINVLDQRLIYDGRLQDLKAQSIEIHARSIFLQGLLVMEPDNLNPYFDPIKPLLKRFHQAATNQGMTCIHAAIVFVRDVPEIDTLILGVNDFSQLEECMAFYRNSANFNASELACNDPSFVNPALWRLR